MNILSIDTLVLAVILFGINFIAVLFIRTEDRLWLPTLTLWIILLAIFLIIRSFNSNRVDYEQMNYELSQQNKDQKAEQEWNLNEAKATASQQNNKLFVLLGCQTMFCLFFHAIGFAGTNKNYYKTSTITFFLLSVAFLLTEILT